MLAPWKKNEKLEMKLKKLGKHLKKRGKPVKKRKKSLARSSREQRVSRPSEITGTLRRITVVALLVSVMAASIAGSAAAKVLATTHGGPNLFLASAVAGLVKPRALAYTVTSKSSEPLAVAVSVECSYGQHDWHRSEMTVRAAPPIRRHIRLPLRHPLVCVYSVDASRRPPSGTIVVTLLGEADRVFGATGR